MGHRYTVARTLLVLYLSLVTAVVESELPSSEVVYDSSPLHCPASLKSEKLTSPQTTTTSTRRSIKNAHAVAKVLSINVNKLMDGILAELQRLIRYENMDRVPLPDVGEDLYFGSYFRGVNGTLTSLASIRRTGNDVLSFDNNTLTLTANFGLKNVDVRFMYTAKTPVEKFHGSLSADVGYNNVTTVFTVRDYCVIKLESLNFEYGDVRVTVYGAPSLEGLVCKIVNKVQSKIHGKTKKLVEDTLRTTIERVIAAVPCPLKYYHEYNDNALPN